MICRGPEGRGKLAGGETTGFSPKVPRPCGTLETSSQSYFFFATSNEETDAENL